MAAKTKTKVKSPPRAAQTPTREKTKPPLKKRLGSALGGLNGGIGGNGQPPAEDMASTLAAPQQGPGLLDRARLTEAMQSQIGNTRLNGQMAGEQVAPPQAGINGTTPSARLANISPLTAPGTAVTPTAPAANGTAKTAVEPAITPPLVDEIPVETETTETTPAAQEENPPEPSTPAP